MRPDSESSEATEAAKLRAALDLHEAGVSLMRARLRRLHPSERAAQIERRLVAWLLTRPGAEHGDAAGRVREWR